MSWASFLWVFGGCIQRDVFLTNLVGFMEKSILACHSEKVQTFVSKGVDRVSSANYS